ncbi:hypothetical protein H5410_031354 [Solanum commersonii]|uniref:Uncharacterized protein n=1 Tax=Solanum commersonii TaxID=4109 RepID=A0A9J5YJY3_SOLCO|nr:hypothetical protein H5410_031354 [Solanum commersonii]
MIPYLHREVNQFKIRNQMQRSHSKIRCTMHYAAKDHLTLLVGIADLLGDLPFGLVHRLSALSFSKFKLCNIGR